MIEQIMKLPIGVRLIAPVFALGLCFGTSVGLYIGWIAFPVQIANVDISDLKSSAQEDYILLVAKTYSYDQDLDRAHERLDQLNEHQIVDRVAALALEYASQNRAEAAQIAALAIALGSGDEEVALIAQTPSAPIAKIVTPTATATLVIKTTFPTLAPATAVAASTPVRTPTRRPPGTTVAAPAPTATIAKTATPSAVILPIAWLPEYPKEWPGGVYFQSANVAAGQKFWHLSRALYCNLEDARNDCKNRPGGDHGIGVWITLVDGYAPILLDGTAQNLPDKSSDTQCQCTFVLDFPDGRAIQVGNYPSDKIGGLALSSVKTQIPQTHVRYFLTFQLATR